MADQSTKSPFGMGAFDVSALASMGAAYQRKLLEFGQENAKAALDFATSLATCRTPSDFMSLTQNYTRQQMDAVQRQTRELMEIAQKPVDTHTANATPV